ncbi:MAG: PsbP-related protein, partial [Actinomycetota bacterium]
MRRRVIAVLVFALLSAACSASGGSSAPPTASGSAQGSSPPIAASAPPAGFVAYANPAPAFSMVYPSGWTASSQVKGAIVAFLAPTESQSDTFHENVNVLSQQVPSGMTLAAYTKASLANVGNVIDGFQAVAQGSTTLSGLPATWLEYTGTASNVQLHWYAEWTVT